MQAYITSIGVISPQNTTTGSFVCDLPHRGERILRCIEPDYRQLIPASGLRRMSRVIKLGLGTAQICLNDADNIQPDAILVGTGLACINELETFLLSMLDGDEQGLSPIPFINSSHNTVAAQISRFLYNHSYNNTYCHRGASFESALIDALMLIGGGEATQVLVGGMDEFSMHYHNLLTYAGETAVSGEGAAFFMLCGKPQAKTYARVTAVETGYRPDEDFLAHFLDKHRLSAADIDVVLRGVNGTPDDEIYHTATADMFPPSTRFAEWKHLCGEYMTSGSFALALAAHALHKGKFPASACTGEIIRQPERILIFNHYRRQNYTLTLLEKP
ncbi:MAG: beta-ketoacyl synthase chain length factor [Bacteroidales bacterium]|jgi:3-oxoacyl-(acyl-carrier-protein) synthase|nr:beta-ketoacyl synthase chain length factor [Bacteroidales bacterium]